MAGFLPMAKVLVDGFHALQAALGCVRDSQENLASITICTRFGVSGTCFCRFIFSVLD
jgi:hypothetical protein